NPGQIQRLFKKSFFNNKFGTVTVLTSSSDKTLQEIEITPYRIEKDYKDKRHPEVVKWAETIQEDLSRRDFTVNAIALSSDLIFEDPYNGKEDIKEKIIKAVRDPEERFSEDALRMMRAIRFATTLEFKIEPKTQRAIKENSQSLSLISSERIKDELIKIIMSDKAFEGIELLRQLGLLKYIIPELLEGYKVGQNKHHIYDCYTHSLLSFKYAVEKKFNQYVRLAALLHDIGKPRVKQGHGPNSTFYNHEIVGAKMTQKILERLKFSKKDIEKITKLVRYHLFYYNVGEVSEASVRKLVSRAGQENMEELLQVRMADRIGSGVPKAEPYKLRHLKYVIEKTSQDPISVKKLKVSGQDVMDILKVKPGPKIGQILEILLNKVLLNPDKNKKSLLKKEIKQIDKLSDKEILSLAERAKKERQIVETKRDEMTKRKYWVI
ncbi:MAG: HD domain-containing protein, partial [Candidatus Pacebacteria bacterium]|nr:HD domain-containing protein [Candidatus Paceibacterota bacterium]